MVELPVCLVCVRNGSCMYQLCVRITVLYERETKSINFDVKLIAKRTAECGKSVNKKGQGC